MIKSYCARHCMVIQYTRLSHIFWGDRFCPLKRHLMHLMESLVAFESWFTEPKVSITHFIGCTFFPCAADSLWTSLLPFQFKHEIFARLKAACARTFNCSISSRQIFRKFINIHEVLTNSKYDPINQRCCVESSCGWEIFVRKQICNLRWRLDERWTGKTTSAR